MGGIQSYASSFSFTIISNHALQDRIRILSRHI
jgi:hypothetical protein